MILFQRPANNTFLTVHYTLYWACWILGIVRILYGSWQLNVFVLPVLVIISINSWNRSQRIVNNPTNITFQDEALELAYLHQATQTYPYQNLAYAIWVTKFDIPNLRKIALYHKTGKHQTVYITLLRCAHWKELENIRQALQAKKIQRVRWKFDTTADMILIMLGLFVMSQADSDTTAFELGEAIGDLGEEMGTAKHDKATRLENDAQNYLDK